MRNKFTTLHNNVVTQGRCHILHCIPENSLSLEMLGFDFLAQIWTIPLCSESRNQSTVWGMWHTKICCFCWLGWCYSELNHLASFSLSVTGTLKWRCCLLGLKLIYALIEEEVYCSAQRQNSKKQSESKGWFLINQSILCPEDYKRQMCPSS